MAAGPTPPERPRGTRTRSAWLLAVPFLLLARPTPEQLGAGTLLAWLGLLLRGWAAGTIRKDETLTTSGPYAHLRHPLYVGSFLVGIGLAVAGGHWVWVALVIVYFLVIYRRTIAEEGERLGHLFGARYRAYVAHVPGLVPRLMPFRPAAQGESAAAGQAETLEGGPGPAERRSPSHGGFAWSRYLRNREWEALLGAAAALALLAAKMLWLG